MGNDASSEVTTLIVSDVFIAERETTGDELYELSEQLDEDVEKTVNSGLVLPLSTLLLRTFVQSTLFKITGGYRTGAEYGK